MLIHGWQWSMGTFHSPGPIQLAANNFYGGGTTATANYYLDDYSISRLDVSGVAEPVAEVPAQYTLEQNYPNPFNPATTIRFQIPKSEFVTLKIYNLLGEEVATLLSNQLISGFHSADWDASRMASGVYFYRLEAGSYSSVKKMLLLK